MISPLRLHIAQKTLQMREPISIPNKVWDCYLDPIDKEIYWLLEDKYPYGYTITELLKRLKEIKPEENEDYTLQDVCDSLMNLKDYVVKKGKYIWTLKNKLF